MSLKIISFSAIFLITANCFSQDKTKTDISNITKVTFLSPGISYEKRIGKFQSFHAEAFAGITAYLVFSDAGGPGTRSGLYIDPVITLQYRYYYNFEKRKAKVKRTEMNSLNYLCSMLRTIFSNGSISSDYSPEDKRRAINMFGIAGGLQRNYQRRFSLDITPGGGYVYTKTTATTTRHVINKNVGKFTSVADIKPGFWLNKRK